MTRTVGEAGSGPREHLQRINPPELAAGTGFSHATVGVGRIVFLAGQTALDPSGAIVGDTIVAQFRTALGNLLTALRAAGGRPADLASLTVYLTDVSAYRSRSREIGRVWRDLAGTDYPAMAVIGIDRLWDREALVEIQGFAVLPPETAPPRTPSPRETCHPADPVTAFYRGSRHQAQAGGPATPVT